ncbi:MAG: hypothetical protein ACLUEQ_05000 [Cloacibacillus evryensis]
MIFIWGIYRDRSAALTLDMPGSYMHSAIPAAKVPSVTAQRSSAIWAALQLFDEGMRRSSRISGAHAAHVSSPAPVRRGFSISNPAGSGMTATTPRRLPALGVIVTAAVSASPRVTSLETTFPFLSAMRWRISMPSFLAAIAPAGI